MANDYYNYSNDFVPGQKVQSLNLDQEFAAIAAAFDKLGDPTTILNGAGVGGTESGTADNYVVDNGGGSTLADLQMMTYIPTNTNTGAAVVALNGGSNKAIKRNDGSALQAGDLLAGIPVLLLWDASGDRWVLSGATAAQASSTNRSGVSTQSGTSYTLTASDENDLVQFTNGSAVTITLPSDSTEDLAIGFMAHLHQAGAGQLTIVGGSGVTVRYAYTLSSRSQYSAMSVMKVAANTWAVIGDVG